MMPEKSHYHKYYTQMRHAKNGPRGKLYSIDGNYQFSFNTQKRQFTLTFFSVVINQFFYWIVLSMIGCVY